MKIRKNDLVIVATGDDASVVVPTGDDRPRPRKVLEVLDGGKKLLIEGVNRVYKHVKRGHPRSPQGGRLSLEMPVDASVVMYYCESCGRGVRLGVRYRDDGGKERYCKRCGKSAGTISPPKGRYARSQ